MSDVCIYVYVLKCKTMDQPTSASFGATSYCHFLWYMPYIDICLICMREFGQKKKEKRNILTQQCPSK